MLLYILLLLIVIIGAVGVIYAKHEQLKFDNYIHELEQNIKQKR